MNILPVGRPVLNQTTVVSFISDGFTLISSVLFVNDAVTCKICKMGQSRHTARCIVPPLRFRPCKYSATCDPRFLYAKIVVNAWFRDAF